MVEFKQLAVVRKIEEITHFKYLLRKDNIGLSLKFNGNFGKNINIL